MADIDLLIDGIRDLEKQSEKILHLTANENRMSNTAKTFISSNLSERYYFKGSMDSLVDFNPFMVRGLVSIEKIAEEAERALAHMLQVKSVNLYPLSGIHAMICAIAVGTNPGDIVMSVDERAGGHFATKTILERMGRKSMFMPLSIEGGIFFDYQKIAASAKKHKVKAVYIDLMSHIRPFNVAKLRDLLGDQVKIIYDASHILGLTLGGQFQNPLSEGADILCGNTHKTLPGPHRGLLASLPYQ
jgi:glycine/serine hydroxymethyltransferase